MNSHYISHEPVTSQEDDANERPIITWSECYVYVMFVTCRFLLCRFIVRKIDICIGLYSAQERIRSDL